MRQLNTLDDRGQASAKRAVSVVVMLAVAGIVTGVLAPVALDAIATDQSQSFDDVATGDTVNVSAQLNATLDSVDTAASPSTATVTVTDRDTGSSTTFSSVGNQTNVTQTLEGEEITLHVDSVSTGQASFTVDYPPDYGLSGGASSLWGILDLAIVLVIFLFLIGYGLYKADL